jgi:hypothetical protein
VLLGIARPTRWHNVRSRMTPPFTQGNDMVLGEGVAVLPTVSTCRRAIDTAVCKGRLDFFPLLCRQIIHRSLSLHSAAAPACCRPLLRVTLTPPRVLCGNLFLVRQAIGTLGGTALGSVKLPVSSHTYQQLVPVSHPLSRGEPIVVVAIAFRVLSPCRTFPGLDACQVTRLAAASHAVPPPLVLGKHGQWLGHTTSTTDQFHMTPLIRVKKGNAGLTTWIRHRDLRGLARPCPTQSKYTRGVIP